MKQVFLGVALGWLAVTPTWAQQPQAGARRDMDIVELRMRVQALEAQVERLTSLLREHLAAEHGPTEAEGEATVDYDAVPRVADVGALPPAHQMPGYPWLRVEEGVLYLQPVPITAEMAALLHDPGGLTHLLAELELAWEGDMARVQAISPRHLLARHLGVRAGDRLVSLNEHLLPQDDKARARLARHLQGKQRFALELLRGKRRVIVAFFVAPGTPEPAPLEPADPELEELYRLVVASQDPGKPAANSVVLQHANGRQITVFIGDELDGLLVEAIDIERDGDVTRATLMLRGEDTQRVLRLNRTP